MGLLGINSMHYSAKSCKLHQIVSEKAGKMISREDRVVFLDWSAKLVVNHFAPASFPPSATTVDAVT